MVALTTLTLWSLGQSIVVEPAAQTPSSLTGRGLELGRAPRAQTGAQRRRRSASAPSP